MPYSREQVITAALNTLRSEGVMTSSEDSTEARFASNKLDMLIDSFLTENEWVCATTATALIRNEATSPYTLLPYTFDRPSSCLELLNIVDQGNPFDVPDHSYKAGRNDRGYKPEGNYIYYSEDTLTMRYIKKIDVPYMREYMIYPLVILLASELAYGITNSANYGDLLFTRYRKILLPEATAKNAREIEDVYAEGQALKNRIR